NDYYGGDYSYNTAIGYAYFNYGNDTYQFKIGDGQDTIYDLDPSSGNTDTLQMIGIKSTAVTALRSASDLILSINSTIDKITLQNYFTSPIYQIENINFTDGIFGFILTDSGGVLMTKIAAAPAKPDLIISSITPSVITVNKGETFIFNYETKDIGVGDSVGSTSGIYLDGKASSNKLIGQEGSDSINAINAGGKVSNNHSFNTVNLTVGKHTLWIAADDGNNITESNDNNNWTSLSFTVTQSLKSATDIFKTDGSYYKTFFHLSASSYVHPKNLPETGAETILYNKDGTINPKGEYDINHNLDPASKLKLDSLTQIKNAGVQLFQSSTELNFAETTYTLPTIAGEIGIDDYNVKFKNGYYVAYNNGLVIDKASVALVGRSSDALFLTFRGTDNSGDMEEDLLSMTRHYARYEPLFEGINTYLGNHPEIKTVYVSGHSLGGQMAMMYMIDHPNTSQLKYEAVTYEAANKFPEKTGDARFTNFEMKADPVPDLGLGSNYGKTVHLNYEKSYDILSDPLQPHYMVSINTQLDRVINALPSADKLNWNERIYVDDNKDGVIITEVTAPLKTLGAGLIPIIGLAADAIWAEDANEYQQTAYNFKTSFTTDGTVVLRPIYGLSDGIYNVTENKVKTVILGDDSVSMSENVDISGIAANWNLTLIGNAGNNELIGGSGNDTLMGGADKDWLIGGKGNDILYGSQYKAIKPHLTKPLLATTENLITQYSDGLTPDAVDVSYLQGGLGNDTLYGSLADNDYFFIDVNLAKNTPDNVDTIENFYIATATSNPTEEDYLVFSSEQLGINMYDIDSNPLDYPDVLGSNNATYLSSLNFQVEKNTVGIDYGFNAKEPTFILATDNDGLYFDKDGNNSNFSPKLLAYIHPSAFESATGLTDLDADQVLLLGSFNNLTFA
ncbi:MAG: CARDB domain-containing protein, partial [Methylococcaceae bacterium]